MSIYGVTTIFRQYIKGYLSYFFSYIYKFLFVSISHLPITFKILTCFASHLSLYFNVILCILHLFHSDIIHLCKM